MSPKQQPKPFKDLQAEWDKKLAESGFKDIEQRDGNLKDWDSHRFRMRYDKFSFESRRDYYIAAEHFLNSHGFSNKKELMIWKLHSEGVSMRSIVIQLEKKKIHIYRAQVKSIIDDLTEKMIASWNNR